MPVTPRRPRMVAAFAAVLLVMAAPAWAQDDEPKPEPMPTSTDMGPEADLTLTLDATRGTTLVGDPVDFELEVRNAGPEDADDASVYGYLSDSFVIDDLDPGCTSDGYGGFSCVLGDLDAEGSRSFSLSAERVRAREAWTSFSAYSNNYDPAYENNYAELYFEPDTSNPADLSVSMDAPDDPELGEEFTYEIEVTNEGPEQARAVELRDSLPSGVEIEGWESSVADACELHEQEPYVESSDPPEDQSRPGSYVYRELRCQLGSLPPDETATIEITVERNDPYELWNYAWVMTSSYDENYENDYAYSTTAPDESVTSDLSVSVDGPVTPPLVGDRFDLVFTVGNDGPAPAPDASLVGFLPDGMVFESSSTDAEGVQCSANGGTAGGGGAESDTAAAEPAPSEPAGGDAPVSSDADSARSAAPYYYGGEGFNCTLGSLGVGDSATITVTATRSKARELWATGWVWSSNHDPDYEDSYGEARVAPDTTNPADLSVTMTGPDDAEVGDEVRFDIEVANGGPMEARSVVLSDSLPYGLEFVSATPSSGSDTCSFGGYDAPYAEARDEAAASYWGYQQLRCELGTMGSGETSTVELVTRRTTEYEVWNSAFVESASYDPDPDDDFASSTLRGEPYPCGPSPAGTGRSDDIAVYDCPVEAGGGDDSIVIQADSTSRDVDASAGRGSDDVTVNVPTGSEGPREITVRTGRGDDNVNVVVAPGVTGVTVVVRSGPGSDRVTIDAPALRRGVRIAIIGGRNDDVIVPSSTTQSSQASWRRGFLLSGGSGADLLVGAYANDNLFGGRGPDVLEGAAGDDELRGGRGKDTCRGGPGRDDSRC